MTLQFEGLSVFQFILPHVLVSHSLCDYCPSASPILVSIVFGLIANLKGLVRRTVGFESLRDEDFLPKVVQTCIGFSCTSRIRSCWDPGVPYIAILALHQQTNENKNIVIVIVRKKFGNLLYQLIRSIDCWPSLRINLVYGNTRSSSFSTKAALLSYISTFLTLCFGGVSRSRL